MEEVVSLPTLAATRKLGKSLAKRLKAGDVLALVGDLGAGKTTFTQALAAGLGVRDGGEVVSPTYTLANEHPIALGTLIHIDLYRLPDAESAEALGFLEMLDRDDAIVVVEWANRFPQLMPAHTQWLTLSFRENGERVATFGGPPSS